MQSQDTFIRLLRKFLTLGLGSEGSPDRLRVHFLKITSVQIGILFILANGIELLVRPEASWYPIPALAAGFLYLLVPLYLKYVPNDRRLVQVSLVLFILLLVQRALSMDGLASPILMWLLVIPLFSQAFVPAKFARITSALCVCAILAIAALDHLDFFGLWAIYGTVPYWLHGFIALGALYVMTTFGFYSGLLDSRQEEYQRIQLALENENSVSSVLSDFCRSVAHQVRTPLTTLGISSELLESKLGSGFDLSLLRSSEKKVETIVQALLFITEAVNDDTAEVTQIEGVVKRALNAFSATTQIPSFQYLIRSNQTDTTYSIPPVRFAKLVWRLARILEPALVTSAQPTLLVSIATGAWGLEIRFEVAGASAQFLSPALMRELETQANRVRTATLGDKGVISILSPAENTLLMLLLFDQGSNSGSAMS